MKKNCWEIMKCGREPGGESVSTLGVCPACINEQYDGIHSGTNGGRTCWMVHGTLCEKESSGDFYTKYLRCINCPFYKKVQEEEGNNFKSIKGILSEYGKK